MATHAPVHPGVAVWPATTLTIRQGPVVPLRTVVMTIGAMSLWIAVVLGTQQINRHDFGLSEQEAWALALAVVSYVAVCIGLMVGVISLVRQADRVQEQREA